MKLGRISPTRFFVYLAILLAMHSGLLIVVERSGVVEKLMAGTYGRFELLVILLFIVTRLAVYLALPGIVVGYLVHQAMTRFLRR